MVTRVGFQVLPGAVGEVDQENKRFSAYYERVLLFFEASGIDAAKHVPMFLSLLGADIFVGKRSSLANLTAKEVFGGTWKGA